MQQIHFIVGDERRFFDFIKRLDGRISMNEMLKKLTFGLEGASGGGHIVAGGGHVRIKDTDEFKRRVALRIN